MVFKQIGDDADKFTKRMGLFSKSFADIKKDLSNGLGIRRGLFSFVSKKDIQSLNDFNKAINNGTKYSEAFNTYMSKSPIAIKRQANELIKLHTQQKILNQQYQKNQITQEQYNAAMTANKAQVQALTSQTQNLTLAQRAATATSKALSIGLNLIGNIAIASVINLIITGITKLVNKEKELCDSAKESANEIKSQADEMKKLASEYEAIIDSEKSEAEKTEELNEWKQNLVETYGFEKDKLEELNTERERGIELLKEEIDAVNQRERGIWLAENSTQFTTAKEKITNPSSSSNSRALDGSVESDIFTKINQNNIRDSIKNKFNSISTIGNSTFFDFKGENLIETYDNLQNLLSALGNAKNLSDDEKRLLNELKKEEKAIKKVLDDYQVIYETGYKYLAQNNFDDFSKENPLDNVGKENYLSWRDGLLATAEGDTALEKELLSLVEQQFPDYAKYFENLNKAEIKFGVNQSNDSFNALKKSLLGQLSNEQLEIAIQIPDLFTDGSFDGTFKSITDRIDAWNKSNGNTLEVKFNYSEYSEQVDNVIKNIDTLQSALDNLNGGKSLEAKDITELANTFPDYSTKILSAANSTEELKLVLTDIKRNAPKSLINTLENLSGLSKQDQEAVNGLISVLTTVNDKTSTYADTLADLETKESLLSSVYKEMHDDGQISISTYQKLIEMGDDYANMVTVINGKITVNTQDLKELTKKKYEDEIATLKLTKAELGYNIASNPQNYSLYAEKISAINADIEAKEKALELLNAFDYTTDNNNSTKDEEPTQITNFKKDLAEKQHLVAMKKLSEEEYLNWLDGAYKTAYAGLEGYEDDLYKYEEEIFSKRRELAEKTFDDTIDGIEKEIDALEKLKDNASLDINAEGSIYSVIDQQILLYQQAIDEIGKRIAELEASGLVGIEDEIEELNKQKDDLLEKVYDLGKERTSTGIENEISYWEEMQSKQNEFYDKQIEKLKKQKELLEDKNDEEERAKDLAEKQLELRKAQIALEDARRNRNVLVYTAGGGYSYEADQTAISEAEEDVKKAEEDLAKTEKDILKDGIDRQIDILEEQKDKDSEYYDTIIKLLEDMSGKNKVQSESNRSIWGELLATEAGQKALAQIDPEKLQELLDSGFLVQKDGKYSLGEKKPNDEKDNEVFKAGTDVIKMLSTLLHKPESEIKANEKLMNAVSGGSGIWSSLTMPSQSALSELTKAKSTAVTNYNNSKISNTYHVDKIDVGYSGDDFNGLLEQAFTALNQAIVVNGNKVAYGN